MVAHLNYTDTVSAATLEVCGVVESRFSSQFFATFSVAVRGPDTRGTVFQDNCD